MRFAMKRLADAVMSKPNSVLAINF